MESLSAKPTAKPVKPRLATIAETLMPTVPNAVTKPTSQIPTYATRASKFTTLESIPVAAPALRIIFLTIIARIQKTMRIRTDTAIFSAQSPKLGKTESASIPNRSKALVSCCAKTKLGEKAIIKIQKMILLNIIVVGRKTVKD